MDLHASLCPDACGVSRSETNWISPISCTDQRIKLMNNIINVKALVNSKSEQGQTESCNILLEKKENKTCEQEKQKGKLQAIKIIIR